VAEAFVYHERLHRSKPPDIDYRVCGIWAFARVARPGTPKNLQFPKLRAPSAARTRLPHFGSRARKPGRGPNVGLQTVEDDAARTTLNEINITDIAIIIVTYNSAGWIEACLRSVFASLGRLKADVVVVDADSRDHTADIVASEFPEVRLIRCRNGGFGYANNRGLMTCDARYVLFLNPDTEILHGSLDDLVDRLDQRLEIGLIGVRQVDGQGQLDRTIRRFPNALRALGDNFSAEHLPRRPRWLGEREIDLERYEHELECDWTSGSFMLARREALESSGYFDERFFMYSEETDLCRRIKTAGWQVRHLPSMTIRHYGADVPMNPSLESLQFHSRIAYARKHFVRPHRALHFAVIALALSLRSLFPGQSDGAKRRRAGSRAALSTVLGRSPVPYGPPSQYSVAPEERPRRPRAADERAREIDRPAAPA
jgi:N-acetylglucosaminyl-diphospho-decaprenol L-rhamnosyltransferase